MYQELRGPTAYLDKLISKFLSELTTSLFSEVVSVSAEYTDYTKIAKTRISLLGSEVKAKYSSPCSGLEALDKHRDHDHG